MNALGKGRVIITGASGSMGAVAVEKLAASGFCVTMACRNLAKASGVRDAIFSRIPDADIEIRRLDLSSLESVRYFAEGIETPVLALFNNAGAISRGYSLTVDGLEHTFAVNYFGPWLLTQLLLPRMADGARVVNMVSLTCRFATIDESSLWPAEREFRQLGTYAAAKRALLSFSMELARRNPSLVVNVADPGIVASNMIDLGHWYDPLADALFKPLCRKPEAGVEPALRALASSEGGLYFSASGSWKIPGMYVDPALDERIWASTERFISF